MTSSETSTEPPPRGSALFVLAIAGAAVLAGWAFVLWHHHFRVTAPVVILMMGWTSVVASVYFLWRTADNADLDDEQDWWRVAGRHEELVREKRSLLKAIKETELDRDTGKLSKADAEDIISRYRQRAIEVIKAVEEGGAADQPGADPADQVRARIEREVRARVVVDAVGDKKKKKAAPTSSAPASDEGEDEGESSSAKESA